jgi:hypothetical protein
MATFLNTLRPTPFGLFDADTTFQTEADNMILFVKRALGDDVVSVALPSKTIWALFEEASWEFSRLMNEHQIVSNFDDILGQSTGSDIQGVYPRETLDFLIRQAEPYAMEAGYQGYNNHVSGSITLTSGRQDYDLHTDLVVDGTSTPLHSLIPSGSSGMRIMEVLHFSPTAAYRFFDSTSAINFLNNEFSFESFTPETVFYVLPVFEDLLRAGQMQLSQRARRSNYYYKIRGHSVRIFPMPTGSFPKKLWVRVMYGGNPFDPNATGIVGGDGSDPSLTGVSNPSNAPYGDLVFANLNTWSKAWIRKYTLALCMTTLGYIRGKYNSIPVPNGEVTLNYGDLLTHGREDKIALTDALKETLQGLTTDALIEKEATKAENLTKQLRGIPMPNGYQIVPG